MSRENEANERGNYDQFAERVEQVQTFMYNWAKSTARPEDIRVYKILDLAEKSEYLALHRTCFEFIMEGEEFLNRTPLEI